MLSGERRQRLAAAMAEAGIDEMVLYGNAWQDDYLRYATDFGILEGHGIALVAADGTVDLFVDSVVRPSAPKPRCPTSGLRSPAISPARSASGSTASPTIGWRRRRAASCPGG